MKRVNMGDEKKSDIPVIDITAVLKSYYMMPISMVNEGHTLITPAVLVGMGSCAMYIFILFEVEHTVLIGCNIVSISYFWYHGFKSRQVVLSA